jgi:hypothetical protein
MVRKAKTGGTTQTKKTLAGAKKGKHQTPAATGNADAKQSKAANHDQTPDTSASLDYERLFRELVAQASAGDQDALRRLRGVLDLRPEVWRRAGNLSAVAERAWTELLAGSNALAAESIKRRAEQLRRELCGPEPTPMESLLVDQAVVTWMATAYSEMAAANASGSLGDAAFRLRRAESSQRRHLAALRSLATLRALLPAGLEPRKPRIFDPTKVAQ